MLLSDPQCISNGVISCMESCQNSLSKHLTLGAGLVYHSTLTCIVCSLSWGWWPWRWQRRAGTGSAQCVGRRAELLALGTRWWRCRCQCDVSAAAASQQWSTGYATTVCCAATIQLTESLSLGKLQPFSVLGIVNYGHSKLYGHCKLWAWQAIWAL